VFDWITLSWREQIGDGELPTRLRGEGVIHPPDGTLLEAARRGWPSIREALSADARGLFTEEDTARYPYLTSYSADTTEIAGKIVNGNGPGLYTTQVDWVNHWRLPSFEDGVRMFHRLGGQDIPERWRMTEQDLAHLGNAAGIPEFWQRRIEFMMQPTLESRRLKQLFEDGVVSGPTVLTMLSYSGIPPGNAQTYLAAWTVERMDKIASSVWGKGLISGEVSDVAFAGIYGNRGMPADEIAAIILYLHQIQGTLTMKACIAGTKQQFMTGGYTVAQAQAALLANGTDPYSAITITTGWACQLAAKSKIIPAAKLCKWQQDGLISLAELATRLGTLGYSPGDAQRMIGECQLVAAQKASALATKANNAANKKAAADAKAAAAAAAKAKAAEQKAATKKSSQDAKVETLIGKIAALMSAAVADIGPAIRLAMQQAQASIPTDYAGTIALLAGVVASMKANKLTAWLPTWNQAVADLAQATPGS
jgi:hypothetical protein